MNEPWRRFKSQPWRLLSQVALLTTVLVVVLESLLIWGSQNSELFRRFFSLLFSPPLGVILPLAAAMGFGGLGVYICERWRNQVILNSSSLWALVLCLTVSLFLKSLLPIPALLVGFSYTCVVGVIFGVFWKGRPYWRY